MAKLSLAERLDIALTRETELTAALESVNKQLASSLAALEESNKRNAELAADVESKAASLTLATAGMESAKAELAAAQAALADAQAKLALKQFDDIGAAPVVDASANDAQPSIRDQFNAISDPAERTKFYRANKKALVGGK